MKSILDDLREAKATVKRPEQSILHIQLLDGRRLQGYPYSILSDGFSVDLDPDSYCFVFTHIPLHAIAHFHITLKPPYCPPWRKKLHLLHKLKAQRPDAFY